MKTKKNGEEKVKKTQPVFSRLVFIANAKTVQTILSEYAMRVSCACACTNNNQISPFSAKLDSKNA